MIIGIGYDAVEHSITEKFKWNSDIELLHRIFSQKELELYCSNKTVNFLSGRFAAKEAVLKCLGTGMHDGISLTDISILREQGGKPEIVLINEVKRISDKLGVNSWHISITHSTTNSFAFVIAERREV